MVKPHSSINRKHTGGMHAQGMRGIWPAVLFLVWILGSPAAHGSSLVYKNYIVRYDRGWDVLCEPYVVQRGDWVLKICRQKGEIANQNFRDLQHQLEGTENRINVARVRYNEAVRVFNTSIRTFPSNLTNNLLLKLPRREPFKAEEGAAKAPAVKF